MTMQQAIYRNITARKIPTQSVTCTAALRCFAQQWDFYGVLALMGSSAAYGVFALLHLA